MEIDNTYKRATNIINDSEVKDETNVLHSIEEINLVRKLVSNDLVPTRGVAIGIDTINTTNSLA